MVKGGLIADPDTGSPRIWERRDGTPGASFEVTAREIIYLGGRENGDGQETQASSSCAGYFCCPCG